MGLPNCSKSLVWASKYHRVVFLRKDGSLGELRYQEFKASLVVDWVCYSFLTVRSVAHKEDYGLEFFGKRVQKCNR